MLYPALVSPDYAVGDILKLFAGMRFSFKGNMIQDLNSVAFGAGTPTIQVPVVFFQGEHDPILPRVILDHYVRELSTRADKSVVYLESSAHIYSDADTAIVYQKIISTRDLLL
jgi:pimeloyl-ACP methyl ester carboxylesterase